MLCDPDAAIMKFVQKFSVLTRVTKSHYSLAPSCKQDFACL